MKKFIQSLTIVLLFTVCFIGFRHYKNDIPVEQLKQKYELACSDYVHVDGMDIHYCIEGTGDTLILLHGTGSSLHTWQEWVDILKDSFTIVRLDLPGFGITGPHPDHDYSADAYNLMLDEFFLKLDFDKFHMAGNSFGGFVCWNYAYHLPNKIKSLILLDPSGYPFPDDHKLPIGFRIAQSDILAPILEKITPSSIVEKTVYNAYEIEEVITAEKVKRYEEMLLRKGNRRAISKRLKQEEPELYTHLKNIHTPSLIMWGDKDAVLPVSMAKRFKEDMPNAQLIIYKGVGHLPMEEIPERSTNDLLSFINSIQK